ncbi:MAG: amino acid adenylation domain-containing protein, partial [Halanaerobiales bacterium]|nr:amino acid adenylation domain-containing protein [Halanaerobiales bacterium]
MDKYLQNILISSGKYEEEKKYWMDKLKGLTETSKFIVDYNQREEAKYETSKYILKDDIAKKIINMANNSKVGIYTILICAVKCVLWKYSNNEDVIIGMPAFKQRSGIVDVLQVLRTFLNSEGSFRENLLEVKRTIDEVRKNCHISFEKIIELLNLQNKEWSSSMGVIALMEDLHEKKSLKGDIIFNFKVQKEKIEIDTQYNCILYKPAIIKRLIVHIQNFLSVVLSNIEMTISKVEIISEEEKKQIINDFNDNRAKFSDTQTVYQLFEKNAQKNPNGVALKYKGENFTYGEINEYSNQLARLLVKIGVIGDQLVGIFMERSPKMVASILAVWKAGGAYIPIDTLYPVSRVKGILSDSGAKVLLTKSTYLEDEIVDEYEGTIIELDTEMDKITSEKHEDLNLEINMNNLAYVIYTSGSTGKPKGAMVEHIGMMNHIQSKINDLQLTEDSIVAQNSSHCFDISVWQFFVALTIGGKTCIYENELLFDAKNLIARIIADRVTILEVVPSFLSVMLDYLEENYQQLELIRYLLVTGEAIKQHLVKRWFNRYPEIKMVNAYGPTEASDDITHHIMEKAPEKINVPIGKPVQNFNIYIVDKNMHFCPIGVKGEIWVSGVGVGRGYLNNPERTSQSFREDPFIEEKGVRLYKTGDLGCWSEDGVVEFFGRIDYQVKIRGYRIELGEIEQVLTKHPQVKETVVIDRTDESGDKYLCAYLVMTSDLDVIELREFLLKTLPDYMVPSYFIYLDELPLNANKKIDRKALPDIKGNIETGRKYIPPTNITEEKLVLIWTDMIGIDKIGINDNFFELGGQSLKAIALVGKIYKEFNLDIPLRDIFQYPTIKEMAEYIIEKSSDVENNQNLELDKKDSTDLKHFFMSYDGNREGEEYLEEEYYEASSAQKRMFALNQFAKDSTNYNMPTILKIEGDLDVQRVEEAFMHLVKRHEALRTSFDIVNEEVVQRVHKEVDFIIPCMELEKGNEERIINEFIRPFDLNMAPLIRVELFKLAEGEYLFLFDIHHIISDGITNDIIWYEFSQLYNGNELEKLQIQYKDFSKWQNNLLKSGVMKKQEEYWLDFFKGEIPKLAIPTDFKRPHIQNFEGDYLDFKIGTKINEKVSKLMSDTGATLYMVLLAAYNALLFKYTGQADIVVGSPISGRPYAELENIVGMFVNTLAMRNFPKSDIKFKEFLIEVKENALKAYENQDYQFEELVNKLNIQRDASRNPLFDTMLVLQNMGRNDVEISGLKLTPYELEKRTAKFDLVLTAEEVKDEINLNISYKTGIFKKETIERLGRYYLKVMEEIANHSDLLIKDIDILPKEEKEKILINFNSRVANYPKEKTLHQLFEEQVEKSPHKIAVRFKDEQITYEELNIQAEFLARVLIERGVRVDQVVGLVVERSLEMIVAMLGVLKAGVAYLPINPVYPEERIKYMLKDSGANITLTQRKIFDKIRFEGELIALEDLNISTAIDLPENRLITPIRETGLSSSNLAYVIYTSGSTGQPKGVMVEHRTVINLLYAMNEEFASTIGPEDNCLSLANISFDVSVNEIYLPLIVGARLVIFDNQKMLDVVKLANLICKESISFAYIPPTILKELATLLKARGENVTLNKLLVGVEPIKDFVLEDYLEINKAIKIVNGYGPTETTIWASAHIYKSHQSEGRNVPIGKPLTNTQIYILDNNYHPVPIGVAGEVYIAGNGVTRGYLNKQKLTEEKFLKNPFNPDQRIYRTGDLARWLDCGEIQFVGRIDHQVKIRGYRIEPGEIEAQLLQHSNIKETVVIDREDLTVGKYLCAYIVLEKEMVLDDIKEYLAKKMPEYMIPTYFVELKELPLTVNGKINRKSLPSPDLSNISKSEYIPPTDELERRLVSVWSDLLGVEKIGIMDNFFNLGGQSLLAILLIGRIFKELNVEVPLTEIFTNPNIKGLASYIRNSHQKEKAMSIFRAIELMAVKDYYPVSSAQKRLFVLDQMKDGDTSYNMPGAVIIKGELSKERLEKTFDKLIERHEAFRTSFEFIDGKPVQRVHESLEFKVEYIELDRESKLAEQYVKEFIKPFDLSKASLFRVGLIKIEEEKHLLIYDMHHIISDGISMSILVNEFFRLYNEEELIPLRIQYKDFANWQNELFASEKIGKQEEYWLDQFAGEIPKLNLPTDYPRPNIMSFNGDEITFSLDKELTEKLNEFILKDGATLYMALLATFSILLSKYSAQNDIIIGSPIAGRSHVDLENIIGMFVNTLAMRNYPSGDKTFIKFLEEVKVNSLKAYENQDYQFEMLVDQLDLDRDMSRNPLFDVMFTLQNMESSMNEIQGLEIDTYNLGGNVAKFDLSLTVTETPEEMNCVFEYSTDLFKSETI